MTKTVFLYGDSILWGVNAKTGYRHERAVRVDTVVRQVLGDSVDVISEGMRGRTMFGENGRFPQRDGLAQFGPIFASHLPIDVVVIMLGTNDLNDKTRNPAHQIAEALTKYVSQMQNWCDFMKYPLPKILVVSPTDVEESSLVAFAEIFGGTAELIAPAVEAMRKVSEREGYEFIDMRSVAKSIGQDGIHLDPVETTKLGEAIGLKLQSMLG